VQNCPNSLLQILTTPVLSPNSTSPDHHFLPTRTFSSRKDQKQNSSQQLFLFCSSYSLDRKNKKLAKASQQNWLDERCSFPRPRWAPSPPPSKKRTPPVKQFRHRDVEIPYEGIQCSRQTQNTCTQCEAQQCRSSRFSGRC